jgi:hypothetical protein
MFTLQQLLTCSWVKSHMPVEWWSLLMTVPINARTGLYSMSYLAVLLASTTFGVAACQSVDVIRSAIKTASSVCVTLAGCTCFLPVSISRRCWRLPVTWHHDGCCLSHDIMTDADWLLMLTECKVAAVPQQQLLCVCDIIGTESR